MFNEERLVFFLGHFVGALMIIEAQSNCLLQSRRPVPDWAFTSLAIVATCSSALPSERSTGNGANAGPRDG